MQISQLLNAQSSCFWTPLNSKLSEALKNIQDFYIRAYFDPFPLSRKVMRIFWDTLYVPLNSYWLYFLGWGKFKKLFWGLLIKLKNFFTFVFDLLLGPECVILGVGVRFQNCFWVYSCN